MYKVLLVDDETNNYLLFEKLVNWEEKGFQIAGVAGDGLEALQRYDECQPDLIFMDIQLPLMDGLECVRHIRGENGKVRIVIVSAYGDFAYAQKAIQYGVQDYLLKPVSRVILNQLVDKMKEELDREARMPESPAPEERMQAHLERILRRTEGFERSDALLEERLLLGLMVSETEREEDRGNSCREALMSLGRDFAEVSENRFLLLGDQGDTAASLMETVKKKLNREEIRVFFYERWSEGESGQKASGWAQRFSSVENHGFYEGEGLFHLEETPFSGEVPEGEDLERVFADAIVNHSGEPVLRAYEHIFAKAAERHMDPRLLKEFVLDSLVQFKFALKRYDAQGSFLMLRNIPMDRIQGFLTAQELWSYVEDRVEATFLQLEVGARSPGKNVALQGNAYTELHFMEPDFSVQQVADYIGISKNYFTSQYKALTGCGFWDHVTELRIEKAKELLLTTDELVGTISRSVGYESEFHFSRKFKEYTGLSPQRYRRTVEKGKESE